MTRKYRPPISAIFPQRLIRPSVWVNSASGLSITCCIQSCLIIARSGRLFKLSKYFVVFMRLVYRTPFDHPIPRAMGCAVTRDRNIQAKSWGLFGLSMPSPRWGQLKLFKFIPDEFVFGLSMPSPRWGQLKLFKFIPDEFVFGLSMPSPLRGRPTAVQNRSRRFCRTRGRSQVTTIYHP